MKKVQKHYKYEHHTIEAKWQKAWSDGKIDVADITKAKKPFYNLMMFPYPSAEGLHVGNMYAFTGTDIYGRFKRMQGFDVFEPIGLDGFGIHSENYAFKVGRHPIEQAKRSEENFYRQLRLIGCMYDWTRTVETYDPEYYRWTQWLFVQMFRRGLAYRATAEVNFCPSCKTVLADEQVIEGLCERCGNSVEKRLLEQWFFRITAYAGKLLENISTLKWSEKVLIAQRNWIGKKEGIHITYQVYGLKKTVTVFTTAPVNFGMTFLVLSPEHDLVQEIITGKVAVPKNIQSAVMAYVKQASNKSPQERIQEGKEKTGVFTGLYAINHVNDKKVPIWVTDFVLGDVGTGAVQGCPGHDRKDFQFAKKFDLPIVRVVVGADGDTSAITREEQVIEHGMKGHFVNSEFLDGLDFEEGLQKTMDYFEKKGWGKRVTTYHLRDWLISRQRYWGPPIPMIYCQTCAKNSKGERTDMPGWYAVDEKDLPILLPNIKDYKPGDDGVAPLAKHKEFYKTACPGCGANASRETDVSDTFLDSSWYFLRYPSVGVAEFANKNFDPSSGNTYRDAALASNVKNEAGQNFVRLPQRPHVLPWDPVITKKWLPVTMYTGGAEHSVLHLMYSRFVWMALRDWGYLDFSAKGGSASGWDEPFPTFFAHGLVIKDGAKMSKSKGNVVNPDEYIKLYGTDALRMYLMFMGPFSEGGDFRDSAMEGMSRWVNRVWRMAMVSLESSASMRSSDIVTKALHKTIKKVGDDTEKRHYNTAIAAMMEFTNLIAEQGSPPAQAGALPKELLRKFLLILAPYAPHLAEELWSRVGGEFSIHHQPWPVFDPALLIEDRVTVVVQVNGKLRDSIEIDRVNASRQEKVEAISKSSEKVQKFLGNTPVRKIIFVSGKLINFVV
ncbi:MAG TPA: leucine--tRNA ligase [Patescibacteria group bacterium]|nr:leucine--tRNA ligase [Patescibacteria group bacterium]